MSATFHCFSTTASTGIDQPENVYECTLVQDESLMQKSNVLHLSVFQSVGKEENLINTVSLPGREHRKTSLKVPLS